MAEETLDQFELHSNGEICPFPWSQLTNLRLTLCSCTETSQQTPAPLAHKSNSHSTLITLLIDQLCHCLFLPSVIHITNVPWEYYPKCLTIYFITTDGFEGNKDKISIGLERLLSLRTLTGLSEDPDLIHSTLTEAQKTCKCSYKRLNTWFCPLESPTGICIHNCTETYSYIPIN